MLLAYHPLIPQIIFNIILLSVGSEMRRLDLGGCCKSPQGSVYVILMAVTFKGTVMLMEHKMDRMCLGGHGGDMIYLLPSVHGTAYVLEKYQDRKCIHKVS
jgi:hypothetical protein